MSKGREIVRVDWIDSTSYQGWHAASKARNDRDLRCTSIGFLTEDGPDYVSITNHLAWPDSPDPCVNNTTTIPRCAITKIRKLGARLDEPQQKRRKR